MKIFLSYSHQDIELVKTVYEALRSWGHELWVDYNNTRLGTLSPEDIAAALNWADITLGIMTGNAVDSENILDEWNWTIVYGEELNKRLILLKADECLAPHYYVHQNWIPLFKLGQDKALKRLQKELSQTIENIGRFSSTAKTDPYRDYLQNLYTEIDDELNFLVLSIERLIDIPIQDTPDFVQNPQRVGQKRRMIRLFSRRSRLDEQPVPIDNFKAGFDAYGKRVLLLGDPGSGKTITLLTHTHDAILTRLQNPTQPLPIWGRIATWDALAKTPLHIWLSGYTSLEPEQIEAEMNSGNCLLILDGLDELGATLEEANFQIGSFDTGKLNEFAVSDVPELELSSFDPRKRFLEFVPSNNQIIISCRVKDYEQIGIKVLLNGAITLHTLEDAQIKDYLTATKSTENLWLALRKQPELMDIARVPLLLSLFAFAYQDLPEEAQQLQDLSQGELRDTIFEQYLQKRYEHELRWHHHSRNEEAPYTLDMIFRVLGDIAFDQYGRRVDIDQKELALGLYKNHIMEDATEFSNYMNKLHILVKTGKIRFRFIHLLLRDYFAQTYCIQLDIKHTNRLLLMRAIKIVRDVGGPKALKFMQAVLKESKDENIIFYSIQALRVLGYTAAIPALIEQITLHRNPRVRQFAAIVAREINAVQTVAALHYTLRHQMTISANVTTRILTALDILQSEESIFVLSQLYLASDEIVTNISALQTALLNSLEDNNEAKSKLIAEYLELCVNTDDDTKLIRSLNLLEQIADADDLEQCVHLITSADKLSVRTRMVTIAGNRRLKSALPQLTKTIIEAEQETLLLNALQAFEKIGIPVDDKGLIWRLTRLALVPPTVNIGDVAEDILLRFYNIDKDDSLLHE